jgi:type I restriction enzyme M protein
MSVRNTVKSIQDIMRQDSGVDGDAQRISQLCWMFFMKIIDDQDQQLELMQDDYQSPIPSKLRWRLWAADPEGITGEELLTFVNTQLFPQLKELSAAGKQADRRRVVRDVFEDAYNYMKSGQLMRQVINKINEVDFNNLAERQHFGDIYEQILTDLQSAGNAGEYYTPRAVTAFMVDRIDPHPGEILLDPACGTGGFLTCAIRHMRDRYVKKVEDEQRMQEALRAVEKKQLPHMLCMTNMLLHGIENPSFVRHDNTLARPYISYTQSDRVDIVLTNPPFGGREEDGIESNFPKHFQTRETADLFLALIIRILKSEGRAAVVLPDGSLFGEGVKTRLKEQLMEECNLHTIVRLPNSVFKPYATIGTNLLFFEKGIPTKDIWFSDAPNATPLLRRFVFQLAVRGKLVEQNPKDEPASDLLKRIWAEKTQYMGEGKAGNQALTPTEVRNAPYQLPENWEWTRLSATVNKHLGGGTPSKNIPSYWGGDIPWASVKDVGKSKYILDTVDRITEAGLADSSSNFIPPGHLIVVTRMGLGKVSINRIPIAINQDLRALCLSSLTAIDYHYIFFKTYGFVGTGLTVKGIKVEELLSIPFPLPPLAEQGRIVAKVAELMALCDRLEEARDERDRRRNRLTAASLYHLNSGADARTAGRHASFYVNHLPTIASCPEQIPALREAILNLAVRGRIILQNEKDEPVSTLLERLHTEQQRLIKAGAIPKSKVRPLDVRAELAFEPPKTWEPVAFGRLCNIVTSGSRGWAEFYAESGPKFIRAQNIRFGKLRLDDLACVSLPKKSEGMRTQVSEGDLLVVISITALSMGYNAPGVIPPPCCLPCTVKSS